MSLLEKFQFHMWDASGMVQKLVKEWKPRGCTTEQHFEKSLYDHLHDNLESIQVTKQYARGRIRADIVVGEKVIIELKNNLDATGKYQRLVGQLAEYKEWDGPIIVILCGGTDRNLRKQLDKFLKDENLAYDRRGDGQGVIVVDKGKLR
jgi:hypothetical protein